MSGIQSLYYIMVKKVFIADAAQASLLKSMFRLSDSEVEFVSDGNAVLQCNLTELLAAMDTQLSKSEIDSIKKSIIKHFNITGTDNTFCDDCGMFSFFMKCNVGGVDFLGFLSTNSKVKKIAETLMTQTGTCKLASSEK